MGGEDEDPQLQKVDSMMDSRKAWATFIEVVCTFAVRQHLFEQFALQIFLAFFQYFSKIP